MNKDRLEAAAKALCHQSDREWVGESDASQRAFMADAQAVISAYLQPGDNSELVERLRRHDCDCFTCAKCAAADAIEHLEAERDRYKDEAVAADESEAIACGMYSTAKKRTEAAEVRVAKLEQLLRAEVSWRIPLTKRAEAAEQRCAELEAILFAPSSLTCALCGHDLTTALESPDEASG